MRHVRRFSFFDQLLLLLIADVNTRSNELGASLGKLIHHHGNSRCCCIPNVDGLALRTMGWAIIAGMVLWVHAESFAVDDYFRIMVSYYIFIQKFSHFANFSHCDNLLMLKSFLIVISVRMHV